MFIGSPIWDNESERIGKKKCTPFGYTLHMISDLLGALCLFLFLGVTLHLGYKSVTGGFQPRLLWLFAIPLSLGVIGQILFKYSWQLAKRNGFQYDAGTQVASWMENGERKFYKWDSAARKSNDPGM